jgi:hypothetical protein
MGLKCTRDIVGGSMAGGEIEKVSGVKRIISTVCSINETVDEILTLANYWLVLMARESIKV